MLGHLGIVEWQIGFANSLAVGSLFSYPSHMSYPHGAPIVFGASFAYAQAILTKLFSLEGVDAYGFVSIIFLTIAFWGCVRLLQTLGAGVKLAYVLSASYLASPFIVTHTSYAALAYGMALLPTYAYITLRSFLVLLNSSVSLRGRLLVSMGFVAVPVFALFLDGYTFVMFAMVGTYFVLHACVACGVKNRITFSKYFQAAALYVFAFAAAYVLMRLYISDLDELRLQPANVYRSMGLDLLFVLLPASDFHWLASAMIDAPAYDSAKYYGDASIAMGSYLGISIVTALAGLLLAMLPLPQRAAVATMLCVSFALSLGPSLKYDSQRIDADIEARPLIQYHMPPEAAVLSFGINRLYESVPGIKNMRATYRWHALSIFLLWLLTSLLLVRLVRDGWHRIAGLILVTYVADRAPNLPLIVERAVSYYGTAHVMTRDVVLEMRNNLKPDQIVYFWPSGNDFFVNYAAPILGIRAYNVGGDKNMDISRRHWPPELLAIERGECIVENVYGLARKGELDAIVVPKFDMLRDVSKPWPLDPEIVASHERRFRAHPFSGADFEVQESQYFYAVSLKPGLEVRHVHLPVGRNAPFFETEMRDAQSSCALQGIKGFSVPEKWGRWTDGREAGFVVNMGPGLLGPHELEIEWMGFTVPNHPISKASLYIGNRVVKELEYRHGMMPQTERVPVPSDLFNGATQLSVNIKIHQPKTPSELGLSPDSRQLGVAVRRVCIAEAGQSCSD
jgi:hypothetical protein